jgi:hypothetical protein
MERGVYHKFSGHAVQLAGHRRNQFSELLSRRRRSAAAVIANTFSLVGIWPTSFNGKVSRERFSFVKYIENLKNQN